MAYGDYDGPDKADKGHEGGSCNRGRCQAAPAFWYNHGSFKWYCADCRKDIEFDSFNLRDWRRNYEPKLGHPMFETREMIQARQSPPPQTNVEPVEIPGELEMFEGKLTKVVDASRTGWWRFHAHRDRDGYCDNPARGY